MEIEEVVRRWQVNESQRAIARATGLARETVKKYLAAAGDLGLSATGPPPTGAELAELRRLGIVSMQPIMRVAPQAATLEPYRDQIATWIDDDHLLLTRVQELLSQQQGVAVAYTTLRRYVRQAGLWKQPRSTVRMAPTAPGEVAEMDFGKLGTSSTQLPANARWSGGCWWCWSTAAIASSGHWSSKRWKPLSRVLRRRGLSSGASRSA